MPLGPGFRVGPYEIVASLGAGGMGEVYRARDARLKREVALKVLPEAVAADPERLARFEREAQALAALKHPHIATIHGIEEGGGVRALVLELAEGETLADRIARGAVPIPEAIAIARQIADALEAAHEQGIVHRDLKPANIQVTPDSNVKVLDFGLARIVGSQDGAFRDASRLDSMSPTMTSPAQVTGASVLLGTAAYMSPEQARSKPADKRADVWAFGVVLYEMLTGTHAFAGETVTEVAGAVIHKELDLSALPAGTPESVRLVLRRCLQKDPRRRIRDMGDVRLVLDGAFDMPVSNAPRKELKGRSRLATASAAALIAALLAAAVVWTITRTDPAIRDPVRVEVPTPPVGFVERLAVALSPDGRRLAFIAPDNSVNQSGENRIWIYSFEDGQSRVVAPAETVRFAPLWSPDSQSVAFLTAEGKLKRVALAGGAVQTVADLKSYSGGCWLNDDVIVVATGNGFVRIPASGGTPVQVTEVTAARGESYHAGAWPLPDGRHFLYVRGSKDANNAGVYVGRVDAAPQNQNPSRLVAGISLPVYAAGQDGAGHLLFVRDGAMMAQIFDARRHELIGEAVQVPGAERVHFAENFSAFSASANGAIAYRRAGSQQGSPVFVSRDGKESGSIAIGLERPDHPRVSPDGRSLALIVARDLWKYDLEGRPPVKLTFDGALSPVWTRDGQRIVYEGGGTLRAVPSDGSGKPEQVAPTGHFHPHSVTPDSREVVAIRLGQTNEGSSLVRLALRPDAKPEPITQQGGFSAALSPDGRWLAYTAETTGAQEIWVRPYPGPGAPIRVSPAGGREPLWARNGRELYYLQDKIMMAVAIDTANGFNFKPAAKLFETSHHQGTQPPSYDVTADGRFVMIKPDESRNEPITVVLNWTEMLRSGATRTH